MWDIYYQKYSATEFNHSYHEAYSRYSAGSDSTRQTSVDIVRRVCLQGDSELSAVVLVPRDQKLKSSQLTTERCNCFQMHMTYADGKVKSYVMLTAVL